MIVLFIIKYINSKKTHSLFDKCFVINLANTDTGKERWLEFKQKNFFAPYAERFSGIYGKTYNYNKEIRQGIIKENWDFGKWKGQSHSQIVPLSKGEIGCCLSHYYVWKKIVDENIKTCLILEDDANKVDPQILNKINVSAAYLPKDWDVFLIGFWSHKGNNDTKINSHIWKVKNFVMMHCYIINTRGAKKLMNEIPINMPIDSWVSSVSDKVNIYRHNYINSNNGKPIGNLIFQNLQLKSEISHTNNW